MLTKYIIKDQQLELQDDAAHIIMKGDWHMPSPDQIKELISNTINKWIEKDGIYGMEFISKKDPKKLIFIPAVGAWYNYIYYDNISVHVWSSGLSYGKFAKYLYIDKDGASLNDCDGRHSGLQIRGVIDMKDDNKSKNENLDLTQVLKGVPKGTKLWSSVYGNCTFMNIDLTDVIYPINCQVTSKFGKSTYIGFTKDGRIDINYDNSRCVLFPSETNHGWSTFVVPVVPKTHKEFELNQKVLVGLAMNNQYIWRRDIYLNYDENKKCHCTFYESMVPDSLIIPYDKYADGQPVPFKYYASSSLNNKNRLKFSD